MDKEFRIFIWYSHSFGTSFQTWWVLSASSAILDLVLEAISSCQTWWKCLFCLSGSEVPFVMLSTCVNKLLISKSASEESRTTWLKTRSAFNKLSARIKNKLRPVNTQSELTIRISAGVFKLRTSTRCSTGWTKNSKDYPMTESPKNNLEKN